MFFFSVSSSLFCPLFFFLSLSLSPALPPPLPPPLAPLFASLVNLLQCDVLLAIKGAVLQWAVEPSGGGWTESMLQRVSSGVHFSQSSDEQFYMTRRVCVCLTRTQVLHLVGMALLEEQQQLENSSGDDDIMFNYTSKITR